MSRGTEESENKFCTVIEPVKRKTFKQTPKIFDYQISFADPVLVGDIAVNIITCRYSCY